MRSTTQRSARGRAPSRAHCWAWRSAPGCRGRAAAGMLLGVVGAIAEQPLGALSRSAALAGQRWDGVDQRQRLGDVVDVVGGQRDRERVAVPAGDQVVLGTPPARIHVDAFGAQIGREARGIGADHRDGHAATGRLRGRPRGGHELSAPGGANGDGGAKRCLVELLRERAADRLRRVRRVAPREVDRIRAAADRRRGQPRRRRRGPSLSTTDGRRKLVVLPAASSPATSASGRRHVGSSSGVVRVRAPPKIQAWAPIEFVWARWATLPRGCPNPHLARLSPQGRSVSPRPASGGS